MDFCCLVYHNDGPPEKRAAEMQRKSLSLLNISVLSYCRIWLFLQFSCWSGSSFASSIHVSESRSTDKWGTQNKDVAKDGRMETIRALHRIRVPFWTESYGWSISPLKHCRSLELLDASRGWPARDSCLLVRNERTWMILLGQHESTSLRNSPLLHCI